VTGPGGLGERWWRTALTLAATALAAVGCSPSAGQEAGPQDVVIIGDSITHLAQDEVARREGSRYDFTIRATNEATSARMLDEAEALGNRQPRQLIINLGTNDINKDIAEEETIANVRAIADLFESADCIHIVTLNEHIVSYERPVLAARAEQMNDRFQQLIEEDGDFQMIDWNLEIERYIATGQPEGPLLFDTVHPTEVGQRVLADLYTEALESC
jgi:lysophospholipase L1-like esterase